VDSPPPLKTVSSNEIDPGGDWPRKDILPLRNESYGDIFELLTDLESTDTAVAMRQGGNANLAPPATPSDGVTQIDPAAVVAGKKKSRWSTIMPAIAKVSLRKFGIGKGKTKAKAAPVVRAPSDTALAEEEGPPLAFDGQEDRNRLSAVGPLSPRPISSSAYRHLLRANQTFAFDFRR